MDIRPHINLINNHGYKGTVAILLEDCGFCHKKGDIVLVQEERIPKRSEFSNADRIWLKKHRTIEKPLSEEDIQAKRVNNSFLTTTCPCVGVPAEVLEEIQI